MSHTTDHDDFGGLHRDLRATGARMDRRAVLRLAAGFGAGFGALQLLGCSDNPMGPDLSDVCPLIPNETAGPFPGDGSNGPNVLSETGVVRRDIRSSFAGLTGTADGVPLTIFLTIAAADSCKPLLNYAVYLWQCDRLGRYSLYTTGVTDQNYLRGVQAADVYGAVTFTSIFPGCYQGRWPHIHLEVFPSLAAAMNVGNRLATSQIALPKAACDAVYATAGYEQSVANLNGVSLETDPVFADGASRQLPQTQGSVVSGFSIGLTIAIYQQQ